MARFSSKIAKTSSLEDHIKEMRKRVRNGVVDPHVHRLARNIAAGTWEWQPTRDGRGRIACVPFKDRWHPVAAPGQQPPRCGAREDACVVARIWDFTVLNVRYTSDPRAFDTYVDIGTTLAAGGGDCDDSTIFVCTLAESLGYESIARVISQDGQYWAHVYPCIRVGNRWVPLDTTEHNKQLGWEFPRPAARKDFDMGV